MSPLQFVVAKLIPALNPQVAGRDGVVTNTTEAAKLIEADRREAKLEAIAEIRRRFASPEGHAWGTNGVLDNMTDELEGRQPRFAIRSGAEPDAEG